MYSLIKDNPPRQMGTQKSYVVSLLLFDKEKLLNLMLKYNGGKPRAETKLKNQVVRVIVIQEDLKTLLSNT
ncbi:hypothetical protein HID58_005928 [Brassica napus]|uniref:Uncharacterized protein n=1 Tax=Brassica napus TaxID=3708 RepID=A0ABQ8EAP2_BRANA|nr:hypothetical protein HID58_005928 [Brassica napus]